MYGERCQPAQSLNLPSLPGAQFLHYSDSGCVRTCQVGGQELYRLIKLFADSFILKGP